MSKREEMAEALETLCRNAVGDGDCSWDDALTAFLDKWAPKPCGECAAWATCPMADKGYFSKDDYCSRWEAKP